MAIWVQADNLDEAQRVARDNTALHARYGDHEDSSWSDHNEPFVWWSESKLSTQSTSKSLLKGMIEDHSINYYISQFNQYEELKLIVIPSSRKVKTIAIKTQDFKNAFERVKANRDSIWGFTYMTHWEGPSDVEKFFLYAGPGEYYNEEGRIKLEDDKSGQMDLLGNPYYWFAFEDRNEAERVHQIVLDNHAKYIAPCKRDMEKAMSGLLKELF